jgi:flavorubredoxin
MEEAVKYYPNVETVTEILDAKAIIVGSPSLNNFMFPSVDAILIYINGLKPKGKL